MTDHLENLFVRHPQYHLSKVFQKVSLPSFVTQASSPITEPECLKDMLNVLAHPPLPSAPGLCRYMDALIDKYRLNEYRAISSCQLYFLNSAFGLESPPPTFFCSFLCLQLITNLFNDYVSRHLADHNVRFISTFLLV